MHKKVMQYIFILFSIVLLTGCSSETETNSYTSITIDQMYEIIEQGIIIDVRTSDEYNDYNIEGSINIPYDEIETIANLDIKKDTQIFVYCASGTRSNMAAETLVSLGYTNVYDMGGLYS